MAIVGYYSPRIVSGRRIYYTLKYYTRENEFIIETLKTGRSVGGCALI